MVIRNESHEKANNSKQMKTKRNKSFSRLMWLHLNYKVIKSLNRNMELFRFINGIDRRKLIQRVSLAGFFTSTMLCRTMEFILIYYY